MSYDQILILAILAATVAMFLWDRWRYDMVAGAALLACVLGGVVAPADAFAGFSHPAVITVACVLVLSRGLQTSGAIDVLTRRLLPAESGRIVSIAALVALGAVLSGFMNNVGAMALLMPVAVRLAGRLELPPGQVLMPLAFGTILGGMITLIGTPPNLIVAGFRRDAGGEPFGMFDFAPVGLAVAGVCIAFVVLLGWRLVPVRQRSGGEGFDTGAYITEVRIADGSKVVGKALREMETMFDKVGGQVIGLVRNDVKVVAPHAGRMLRADDILIIEAEAEKLAELLSGTGLTLEEAVAPAEQEDSEADETQAEQSMAPEIAEAAAGKAEAGDDITLLELVVQPQSALVHRSATDIQLRSRYGLNLLALSHGGARTQTRLRTIKIQAGDLLLMQGAPETLQEFAADYNCVPLAERALYIPDMRKALRASAIMVAAIAVAALGLLPTAIAFAAGALAATVLQAVPIRTVYSAVDWPVIILLGALIPVAGAMEATGTAELMAHFLLNSVAQGHAVAGLALILVATMFLSDLMNNAATAAVMCPIALSTATALGANPDTFLMAVAIGASCAFLTPVGHQNNTLILGPGGFQFSDYWQLGLPVELLVVLVSLPMLLLVWPL